MTLDRPFRRHHEAPASYHRREPSGTRSGWTSGDDAASTLAHRAPASASASQIGPVLSAAVTRIFLQLTGRWPSELDVAPDTSDLVLCRPGSKPPEGAGRSEFLPLRPERGERQIAEWMATEFGADADPAVRELVECYFNDFFLYTVCPMVAVCTTLDRHLRTTDVDEVVLVTAKSPGRIPMLGFETAELPFGSADLLYARTARSLPSIFPDVRFRVHQTPPDALCIEPVRQLFFGSANVVFFWRLVLRLGVQTNRLRSPAATGPRPRRVVMSIVPKPSCW